MKVTQKMVSDWMAAKELLDVTKAREMELRKKLCDAVADRVTLPGTYNYSIAGGKLTAILSNNYKLDEAMLDQIKPKLTPAEVECIQVKYALILNKYKLLGSKSLLNRAVVETPSTPTLKFKEDKK